MYSFYSRPKAKQKKKKKYSRLFQSNPFKHQESKVYWFEIGNRNPMFKDIFTLECYTKFIHIDCTREKDSFSISIDVAYRTKQSRERSLLQIHSSRVELQKLWHLLLVHPADWFEVFCFSKSSFDVSRNRIDWMLTCYL